MPPLGVTLLLKCIIATNNIVTSGGGQVISENLQPEKQCSDTLSFGCS